MWVRYVLKEIFCNFPLVAKNVKSRSKIALFSNERHFEIWFPRKRTITFFWSKLSKLHKKDPILHVATKFSLKQGETRTSHGPIPHPLIWLNVLKTWRSSARSVQILLCMTGYQIYCNAMYCNCIVLMSHRIYLKRGYGDVRPSRPPFHASLAVHKTPSWGTSLFTRPSFERKKCDISPLKQTFFRKYGNFQLQRLKFDCNFVTKLGNFAKYQL